MWTFVEQAGVVRETATGLRRHSEHLPGDEIFTTLKLADRLEALAEALEYRWFTVVTGPRAGAGAENQ
jgi:hypothetical protein